MITGTNGGLTQRRQAGSAEEEAERRRSRTGWDRTLKSYELTSYGGGKWGIKVRRVPDERRLLDNQAGRRIGALRIPSGEDGEIL